MPRLGEMYAVGYRLGRAAAVRAGLLDSLRRLRDRYREARERSQAFRAARIRPAFEQTLHIFLSPADLIERFDADYLDDLPVILRENYGITPETFSGHYLYRRLKPLWDYYWDDRRPMALADLVPFAVERVRVDRGQFSTRVTPQREKLRYKIFLTPVFDRVRGRRATSVDDVHEVVEYQAQVSLISGGAAQVDWCDFPERFTSEGPEPWTRFLHDRVADGALRADEPVLDIGPRYASEIRYFRETIGLRGTIGLDLFTPDASLITVGDMHAMPFPDNHFGAVFTRNTGAKAYDFRRFLSEMVRVLRPGGLLCYEDYMDYIWGCDEMARTNVKNCGQILRALGPAAGAVLMRHDTISYTDSCRVVGLLAVQVVK